MINMNLEFKCKLFKLPGGSWNLTKLEFEIPFHSVFVCSFGQKSISSIEVLGGNDGIKFCSFPYLKK